MSRAREQLTGRELWHVTGSEHGGMAEVLGAILGYVRDGGINARWAVVRGGDEFISLTQQLYRALYGVPEAGLDLRAADREAYERVLAGSADVLGALVRRGDVVVLHDPPTAGLIGPMHEAGAKVAWRCHLGTDERTPTTDAAQQFLLPYVEPADSYVFSREQFVWPGLDRSRTRIVPPSINPLSPKNQHLDAATVSAILGRMGLTADGDGEPPTIELLDGSPLRIDSIPVVVQKRPIPQASHVVAHVSKWDRLKDPMGLLDCFADHCRGAIDLVLAGPDPSAIPDEPDSEAVWAELVTRLGELPREAEESIHLVALPVGRTAESAAMVNAIQRRADVVVRKSFAEGFGLSLAEAMSKGTPVVATRVGGIQSLIVDGETGLLVDDPNDLDGFAAAIRRLVEDPELANRLGAAAQRRVSENFLISRHVADYVGIGSALAATARD